MKLETKNISKLEDDFKTLSKNFKSDLKKAGQATVKAQKSKKKDDKVLQFTRNRRLISQPTHKILFGCSITAIETRICLCSLWKKLGRYCRGADFGGESLPCLHLHRVYAHS